MADSEAVIKWIDDHRDEIVEFTLEFAGIASPRGYERRASEFLYEWLDEREFDARQQQVINDRSNVIGTLPGSGSGDGDSILFNGHLDTAHGNADEDRWVVPEDHPLYSTAWQEGEYLLGDDVVNDKGPTAAFLWAVLALARTNADLDADVHVTGSVGEICGAPIDEYQDYERLVGTGVGTRRLLDGGVTADYAVVAEATGFALARMECGLVWFKIGLEGISRYQPLVALDEPVDVESDHPGVLPDLGRAVSVLEKWAVKYRRENTVEYDHGTMQPTAGVGAVRSGNPYMPAKAPGIGALYLDVRLPPGEHPEFVREDVKTVLADAGIDAIVEQYLFRRGYIADTDATRPLVTALSNSHERIRDESTPEPRPTVTSMWRDFNVFTEVGVPCVMFGPLERRRSP